MARKKIKKPEHRFLLQFSHRIGCCECDTEDYFVLGIFASREKARDAKKALLKKKGFAGHPRGFSISRHLTDEVQWTEGFVTV